MVQKRWLEQYLLIFLIFILFCVVIFPLASPIALGFLLAAPCYPLYRKLTDLCGRRRVLSATLVTLAFTVCVVLPLVLIGIGVAKEASKLTRLAYDSARDFDFQTSLSTLRENRFFENLIPFSDEEIKSKIQEMLTTAGTYIASRLAQFASSLPLIALSVILFIVSFFYALLDGEDLSKAVATCLPFEKQEIADLYSTTQKIAYGVLVGSLLAGLTQGLIIGLAFWILGVPGALLFGSMTLIFSFVPILGVGPAGLGGALYLYAQGRPAAALVMLGALALGSVSDNLVKPLVLKGSVELHPLLGLVSVLGGLAVFGFVGLFLGPLIAALMLVIMDMIRRRNALHPVHDN